MSYELMIDGHRYRLHGHTTYPTDLESELQDAWAQEGANPRQAVQVLGEAGAFTLRVDMGQVAYWAITESRDV